MDAQISELLQRQFIVENPSHNYGWRMEATCDCGEYIQVWDLQKEAAQKKLTLAMIGHLKSCKDLVKHGAPIVLRNS